MVPRLSAAGSVTDIRIKWTSEKTAEGLNCCIFYHVRVMIRAWKMI